MNEQEKRIEDLESAVKILLSIASLYAPCGESSIENDERAFDAMRRLRAHPLFEQHRQSFLAEFSKREHGSSL